VAESEVKMLFDLFDNNNEGTIQYPEFLDQLVGKLNPIRARLVTEAFHSLDGNQNGVLELDEVKAKFDPSRHPEVRANLKTVEEARFEFFNLFTTLHSANNQFKNERSVSLQDFAEYHQFISTQFERDIEFRNFIIGVWNMDLVPVKENEYAGKHPTVAARNTKEQWKRDMHKSVFGD